MPPPSEQTQHHFPCQSCGASLSFLPGADALRCEHCGAEQGLGQEGAAPIAEYSFEEARRRAKSERATDLLEGGVEVDCKGCGAKAIVKGQASRCAFCDSPVVVNANPDRVFTPESLLPMAIDRPRAGEAHKRWMASRWFAPSDFALAARSDRLQGVYLPFWTYDAKTTSSYTGQRGDNYQVQETVRGPDGKSETRTVTKIRWRSAFGTVWVPFDDVLVEGTKSLPAGLLRALEPWPLEKLRPYDRGYLSGFQAERYGIDLEEGFVRARERMDEAIRGHIRRDIGGDHQRIHTVKTKYDAVTFKHILLPVWITSMRYGDKVYRLVINAQTGEVSGERPYSAVKITLAILATLLVIGVIWWLTQKPPTG